MFKTQRLEIIKADLKYLQKYYEEFSQEITKFQYPDPFETLDDAKECLGYFMDEMEQGNMLELMVLDENGNFIGSLEAFGLKEEIIDVGLWIQESSHGKGYGYEALKGLIDYLKANYPQEKYVYEVDERNEASIKLIEKFTTEKLEPEEVETESGKKLNLVHYFIR